MVAIKRLRQEDWPDGRLRRRLRREARAIARLDHPHIVRFLDLGEEEGRPFLVMEYVEGQTLFEVARQHPMQRVLELLEKLLAALAYAHARGVIHRDIKPENVLITQSPEGLRPTLLDFGFARVEDDCDPSLTALTQEIFGSPSYMSPEQASGEHELGPQSDLYAIGVILWELFCGQPPFWGSTATAVLIQHINSPLPPFSPSAGLNPPEGLLPLLESLLEKQPAQRLASAGVLRLKLLELFPSASITLDEFLSHEEESCSSLTLMGLIAGENLPLLGRESLQRWLWSRVEEVLLGTSQLLILEGARGIGKSRLIRWLREALAESGWMESGLSAYRPDQPYTGLRAALSMILGPKPGATLKGLGRPDLERVLKEELPWVQRRRALEALIRLLSARRPLLIILEDLHRVEAEELALVEGIWSALEKRSAPVLFLLSTQSLEVHPLRAFLERHQGRLKIRSLPRLKQELLKQLLLKQLGCDEPLSEHISAAARGNPLYALLALQYLMELGCAESQQGLLRLSKPFKLMPRSLSELFRAWSFAAISQHPLAGELWRLMEWLALLGERFPFGLIEALFQAFKERSAPEPQLEALVQLGLLEEEPGDIYGFVHGLGREIFLEETLGREDAIQLNACVAKAKLRWYGADSPHAMEIAQHLREAGQLQEAVESSLRAAEHARGNYRLGLAVACLVEADPWLESGVVGALRARLRIALARLHLDAGEPKRAIHLLEPILNWARGAGAQEIWLEALLLKAEARLNAGAWRAAHLDLEEALALPGAERESAWIQLLQARVALQRGELKGAKEHFQRAQTLYTLLKNERGLSICFRGLAKLSEEPPRALRLLRSAADRAKQDPFLRAQIVWDMGVLLREDQQLERAAQAYEWAIELNEIIGNAPAMARSLKALAEIQRELKQGDSRENYLRASELFQEMGDDFRWAICSMQLGILSLEAEEPIRAEAYLERALELLSSFEDPKQITLLNGLLALTAHQRGDRELREHRLRCALSLDANSPLLSPEWAEILERLSLAFEEEQQKRIAHRLLEQAAEVWRALGQEEAAARCRGDQNPNSRQGLTTEENQTGL